MRARLALFLVMVAVLALPTAVAAARPAQTTMRGAPSGPCSMSAQVEAGHEIVVSGAGFAASTDVAVTQIWDHGNENPNTPAAGTPTTQTVATDAAGLFMFSVPAGPGHGGHYSFTATDGTCTATVDAIAVETAGGTCGQCGGTGPTALPTSPGRRRCTPTGSSAAARPGPPAPGRRARTNSLVDARRLGDQLRRARVRRVNARGTRRDVGNGDPTRVRPEAIDNAVIVGRVIYFTGQNRTRTDPA